MKAIVFATALMALSFGSSATEPKTLPDGSSDGTWVELARTDRQVISGRVGTTKIERNESGDSIVSGVGKVLAIKTNKVYYWQWYVKTADCDQGMGKLVSLHIDGSFGSKVDFVSKDDTTSGVIADALCTIYRSRNDPQ